MTATFNPIAAWRPGIGSPALQRSAESMSPWFLIILILPFGFVAARRARVRRYTKRPCQGRAWKSAFSAAPKHEIRSFLEAFTDAFGLGAKHRLCFSPNDKIDDVYRTIYFKRSPDGLEHVQLLMNLESIYGEIPEHAVKATTLGQLFETVRNKKSA